MLTVQLLLTITEKPVLPVLPPKDGTELTVLIDAPTEESGMLPLKLVFAQLVNSGTDSPVLSVQMVELGTPTLKAVNAQFPQPGTELLALSVPEVEFIITPPINANAQVDKLSTDLSVL